MPASDSAQSTLPGLGGRAVHLWVLSAFAVAQPLFDLLGKNATFFVAHGATPVEMVLFVAVLLAVPPAAAWLPGAVVARLSPRAGWLVHLALVALLTFAIVQPPLGRTLGGDRAALVSLGLALVATVAYARAPAIRGFLTFLAPVPFVFAAIFLARGDVRSIVWPKATPDFVAHTASRDPIVFLLLDEVSTSSLMKKDGTIDERMFPNFARLARGSIWFRNATSMLPMTDFVLPIILGGVYQPGVRAPIYESRPNNLFSLLAGSHRIVAWESVSAFCPPDTCIALIPPPSLGERLGTLVRDAAVAYAHVVVPESDRDRLPPIDHMWGGFLLAPRDQPPRPPERNREGRLRRQRHRRTTIETTPFDLFHRLIDAIQPTDEPTLWFLHVLLPHVPWRAFPSGTLYEASDRPDGTKGLMKVWVDDEWPRTLAFQRYMLQLGYVDRLLGELLDRLEETGLYERTLLVVVGDHGVTFRAGQMYRQPSDESVRDLMHVPFFLKLPGQREGRVSDRNVESIDVLPTVADAIDAELPFAVQGTSALASAGERRTKHMHAGGEMWELPASPPAEWPWLDRKRELLGDDGRWEAVERLSSRPELLGRPIAEVAMEPADADAEAKVEHLDRFADVDLASGIVPAYLRGVVRSGSSRPPEEIAVAVNGKVSAVAPTFERQEESASFGVLLPEAAFRDGPNELEIFAVGDGGRLRRLAVSGS